MKIKIITMLAVVLTGLFLTSCDDKIEVQQAYDFSLTTMPVQKRIKQGETAEIRLQLHKSGNYKETKFFISYFQPDGKGALRMDDGTVFAPNDFYPLKKETFRLYYTSESTDQQAIDVTVYDSFGQRFDLSFSFQNDSDKENEEASL
ncbi:DUF3872 domain-containing protein [Bacteroides thetaiotaomicron]|uniref:DUF3872 domain-containing protein n=1 Tax=Bacteroides thetaiotaomicron TaxID=818 RepID=UPI001CE24E02|nr:DUF3872 domain-containing protein [Bacteroides thetaiotaomicron]MCA6028352.1 DUF3872 domain-containing protein [Bacteroides thetaiotaomicron]